MVEFGSFLPEGKGMQNKTDLVGLSLAMHVRQFVKGNVQWFSMIGCAVVSLVLSRAVLFGGVSPFGVALVSALSGTGGIGAAIGSILGYLLFADVVFGIKYVAAIVIALAVKWIFLARVRERWAAAACVGTCFVALGISSGAVLIMGQATAYDIIISVCELFLGCAAAYFFSRSFYVFKNGILGASKAEVSSVAIAGCVSLMALSSIAVAGLSVGRVFAVLVILICARHAREAGGALAGVAAGVSVALTTGDYSYVVSAYGFGGLAGGLLSQVGKVAVAGAFIVVNTGVSLLTMEFAGANAAIYEAFVASALFFAIPQGLVSRLQPLGLSSTVWETNAQATLRERLEDYSSTLEEIGATTREVSKKLSKLEGPGLESIIERVAERICTGCGMKTACWQIRNSVTVSAMNDAITMLRKDGSISREKMPRHLLQGCCRLDELIGELCIQFNAYAAKEGVTRKVGKVRAVLTEQFDGMALMLNEIAEELCASRPLEKDKAERVREYFSRLNITVHRLNCTLDQYRRVNIELVLPSYQVARLSKTKVTLDLCTILEADFDLPESILREKLTTLAFCEKATYSVELGAYQLSGGRSRLCGDAYDFIRNKGGCAHFVLSDGMGSGGSAAVDSAMACGLLVKLVDVGISYDAALKMVNSALLIKSGEESLATIDVCAIDLFSGKANFYKAGAAPTFVVKGGKAGYVESASLPAGILHGVSFEKSSVTLHEGDIVVMVSDGVTSSGIEWVKSELSGMRKTDMQRLCEKLAVTAKARRTGGRDDDITVLAAALRKGG